MTRALLWPLRLLLRLSKVALAVLFVAALLLSIAVSALSFFALTSEEVFDAVSGIVEAATAGRSIRSSHKEVVEAERSRTFAAERRAQQASTRAARLNQEVGAERTRSTRLNGDLNAERARSRSLNEQVEANRVTYRGVRQDPRDAVRDATRRTSRRLTRTTVTNVGSMFGEALPIIGMFVIASATAYEAYEACAMLDELQELASAFNPNDDPLDSHVCGINVPTADEIMDRVTSSPAAVWEQVKVYYSDLPDWEDLRTLPGQAYDWFWRWFESTP